MSIFKLHPLSLALAAILASCTPLAHANTSTGIDAGVATGAGSVAISAFTPATASQFRAVAIGEGATASAINSLAIGSSASYLAGPDGDLAAAIANGIYGTAMGTASQVSALRATAIGVGTTASGTNSFAGGAGAAATGRNSVALGGAKQLEDGLLPASATGSNAIAVGPGAAAMQEGAVAVGKNARATGGGLGLPAATAIGSGARAEAEGAAALGSTAVASGTNSTALGRDASATGGGSIAVGPFAVAVGSNSIAQGWGASATQPDTLALGRFAQASAANAVAIGANSIANAPMTVSFGSAGNERRLTNVADPVNGTDAVNLSTLNTRLAALPPPGSVGPAWDPDAVHYDPAGIATPPSVSLISPDPIAIGQEVQVKNLADGSDPTDAVNVRQLQAAVASLPPTQPAIPGVTAADLDSRIGEVNGRIDQVEDRAFGGVALSLAMQQPVAFSENTTTAATLGAGVYQGRAAVAYTISKRVNPERSTTIVSGGLGLTSDGQVGARAGVSWNW